MSCVHGYKIHRFTDDGNVKRTACVRCGAPNMRCKVVLLVKPARRPKWWPRNGKAAAWATVNWDGQWVIGYSIGTDERKAFNRTQVRAAQHRWTDDYDLRKWTFKEVPVEPWYD